MTSRGGCSRCCQHERPTRALAHCGIVRPCQIAVGRGLAWVGLVTALAAGLPAAANEEQPANSRPASIPLTLEPADEPLAAAASQADEATGLGQLPFDWQAWAVVLLAGAGMLGLRFYGRQRSQPLPPDVFELLGEATLGGGQPVRIIRFGPKTLLVTTGSGGLRTLAELDDPLATEWVAAACRGDRTLRAVHAPTGSARNDASRFTPATPATPATSLRESSVQSAEVA